MATTRLMTLHVGKGRSIATALAKSIDYIENKDKTMGDKLITSYKCDPMIADQEFLFSKRQYEMITGRNQGEKDIIAYHLRQSFAPGEINPEEANRIGYDLAMSLTKGKHAFVVCTHVDKNHIHSHIIFNSTTLDCERKFRNFLGSSFAIRKISDMLCIQNGLSIIEKPKPSRGHYGTWLVDNKQPALRGNLRELIDDSITKSYSFYEFIMVMKSTGCEVKQGKYLSFKADGQERFIRCKSLGEDYTEEAICERISGSHFAKLQPLPQGKDNQIIPPKEKIETVVEVTKEPPKMNLLIDIENCIRAKGSPGYEQWIKVFNLKEAAQTLIFLQENGLDEYKKLVEKTHSVSKQYYDTNDRIREIDARLSAIKDLQKNIGNYSKTREIYAEYRKLGYSKKFFAEHEEKIILHQSAKKAFDMLGLTSIPSVTGLKTEYATLSSEKNKLYNSNHKTNEEKHKLLIAKNNTERLLNYKEKEKKFEWER